MVTITSFFYFVFGTIFGSFVNVLIYRLPLGKGVVKGRSRCPQCRRILPWHDLIPLASFLILGGRCRGCRKKISWQYPLVELALGVLFWESYYFLFPLGWSEMAFTLFLLTIFLALAVTDLRFLILPDILILAGLMGTAIYGVMPVLTRGNELRYHPFSVDNLLTVVIFCGILYLVWLFSRGTWLGLGDVKLMGLISFIFGLSGTAVILYTAVVTGGFTGLALYFSRKANLKTKLPFGTFICFSAGLYLFIGSALVERLGFYLIFR